MGGRHLGRRGGAAPRAPMRQRAAARLRGAVRDDRGGRARVRGAQQRDVPGHQRQRVRRRVRSQGRVLRVQDLIRRGATHAGHRRLQGCGDRGGTRVQDGRVNTLE